MIHKRGHDDAHTTMLRGRSLVKLQNATKGRESGDSLVRSSESAMDCVQKKGAWGLDMRILFCPSAGEARG